MAKVGQGSQHPAGIAENTAAIVIGKIIALAQSKGGVGKSTTAVNEAICLAEYGELVALIDLGRQLESYDLLVERRKNYPDLPQVVAWTPWRDHPAYTQVDERVADTQEMISKFRNTGAHVVIDCPPVDSDDSPLVAVALDEADIIVCPFLAGGNDYKAYGRSLTMANNLSRQGSKPVLLAFVNKYNPQDNDDQTMSGFLANSGVFTYIGDVPRDVAVKRSTAAQQAVWEWKPNSKGAKAMRTVCSRILSYVVGEVVR